ncbi:MAG: hypothetical protein QXH30_02460, partial [Candidatus Bilamarchaeaceae archaeon]
GQAATEMLVTIGMVLLFIVPILLLLLVVAQLRFESLSEVQGASAIGVISDSINEVCIEGPAATKVVVVNLPTNTKNLTITKNEVILTLETRSGQNELVAPFFGEVAGEMEIKTSSGAAPVGLYPLRFSNKEGKVLIQTPEEG